MIYTFSLFKYFSISYVKFEKFIYVNYISNETFRTIKTKIND